MVPIIKIMDLICTQYWTYPVDNKLQTGFHSMPRGVGDECRKGLAHGVAYHPIFGLSSCIKF